MKLRISREKFEELTLLYNLDMENWKVRTRDKRQKWEYDNHNYVNSLLNKRLRELTPDELFDLECLLLYTKHALLIEEKKTSELNEADLKRYTDEFIRGSEQHDENTTKENLLLVQSYVCGKLCWAERVPAWLKYKVLVEEKRRGED